MQANCTMKSASADCGRVKCFFGLLNKESHDKGEIISFLNRYALYNTTCITNCLIDDQVVLSWNKLCST